MSRWCDLELAFDYAADVIISAQKRDENRQKYEAMEPKPAAGTFVAIDGDIYLEASCEVNLNAKIVAHDPPLSLNRYVTCVGYEDVFSSPKPCY